VRNWHDELREILVQRHGEEQGIKLGAALTVVDRQPFDGPLSVRIGNAERVLGGRVARAMRVELDRPEPPAS